MTKNFLFFFIPYSKGQGPGRGRTGTNAGAGHGGKGGLLFEEDYKTIYGRTYGIRPDIHLIGGSTGKYAVIKTVNTFAYSSARFGYVICGLDWICEI